MPVLFIALCPEYLHVRCTISVEWKNDLHIRTLGKLLKMHISELLLQTLVLWEIEAQKFVNHFIPLVLGLW